MTLLAIVTNTEPSAFSMRRVVRVAAMLVAIVAVVELLVLRSPAGAVSLTVAGAVAIINVRWLEVVLQRVVQPDQPHFDRASVFRIFGRMALLGALFAALVWVPGVDPVAVAVGFSAPVAALVVEGLRWGRRGGG